MTEATLTFDDDIEKLMRSIAREDIAKYIGEKMDAAMKAFTAMAVKVALGIAAKGQQKTKVANTIDREKLAEAIKAKLNEQKAQQDSTQLGTRRFV